jgi:tetratricopeptide (TPR) repeat protein
MSRPRGTIFAVVGVLLAALAAAPVAADTVTVRAAAHDGEGFGRIAFDWPSPVTYEAQIDGETLTVRFARPIEAKLDAILKYLGGYVAEASVGSDGASIVARLRRTATLRSFSEGKTVAIDIIATPTHPAAATPTNPAAGGKGAPAKTADQASTAGTAETAVPIRVATHDGFRRVVFDWRQPTDYALLENNGVVRLRFARAAKLDARRLAQALPDLAVRLEQENDATTVVFNAPAGMSFRHSRSGNAIVLDVLGGKTPGAPAPASTAAPAAPPAVLPPPELIEPAAGAEAPDAADDRKPQTRLPLPPARTAVAPVPPPAAPPLAIHATLMADGASVRFEWQKPTGAAVFRRGEALWIVFAGPRLADLGELRHLGVITRVDQLPHPKATVLRLITRPGINASVRRNDAAWLVELKQQEGRTEAPIGVEPRPSMPIPDVLFSVKDASEPIFLRDPEVGDALAVVPLVEIGRGVDAAQGFVDFQALASVQGIAIRPHADDLLVTRTESGIEVTRPGGLMLSTEADRRHGTLSGGRGAFDFASWGGAPNETFLQTRSRLERAITAASPALRTKPRLALARFYFANSRAAEAAGVLDAVQHDDPTSTGEPSVLLLMGAVDLLTGDRKAAAEELAQQNIDREPDAGVWRASLAAENGDWPLAAQGFSQATSLLPQYPKALRDRLALQAAEAFLETDQPAPAEAAIQLVLKGDPQPADRAAALYLQGRRTLAQNDYAGALELWNQVARMDDRPSRARAMRARTLALLDTAQISRAEAIKQLDGLRFAWRGDMFEFTLLRKLGELKLAEGDQRGAFDLWRQVAADFPDYPQSKDVMKEMSDDLADALLGKDGNEASPLRLLTLYDEFKDFAPVGDRGDAIVRRLIDRLVAVDLLDRAAALLEDRVAHRLSGRDKARGAAQLALLRLLDHHPDDALKALDIDVGKDMPPELLRQRQQLRARALAELDRTDEALAILASDTSRDADRLRADIFWRKRNWPEAARVFARMVPAPAADAKLDREASQLVLNWASALTLAGDQKGVDALRASYGKAMTDTPVADAFRIVAGDPGTGGEADPRALASRVAQVGDLQSFMASYKERLAKDKLSAIN